MPRNSSNVVGGVLDDLKSRLGFGRGDDEGGYDDYDDFDEYDDELDSKYAGYGSDYDENAPVGGFRPARAGSGSSRLTGDLSYNLVNRDDVKASTRSADWSQRAAAPEDTASAGAGAYGAAAEYRPRSEGLDSLFQPSARVLTVLEPQVYGDVERVAGAVRAGDVVVLAMRRTPDALSKRILDFSFGVASALEANVECPGDKVFAIARGGGLTEEEKDRLRSQGAL